MTKLWGPMGWITLHSVSLNYPEAPNTGEQYIAKRFLELFAETISCPSCKNHFKTMLTMYQSMYPNYLASRQSFALFVFRAHNTVNKRLDKPRPTTVADCLSVLRNATNYTSLAQFRQSYFLYLNRNWGREGTGEGIIFRGLVREMIKINDEYWTPRDGPIPTLQEEDVMTPIERHNTRIAQTGQIISSEVGFKGGKLRLMRR